MFPQKRCCATLPDSIVIIGGGGIGMEFAYILHSYGVRVEILEFTDRVLPNEDADVSRKLYRLTAADLDYPEPTAGVHRH